MRLCEKEIILTQEESSSLSYLGRSICKEIPMPLRVAITSFEPTKCACEVGALEDLPETKRLPSIFEYVPRSRRNESSFNVVLLVPTGIGAEIGGHAGDATPVARLLGACCDTLITHPNVVNASDINELPENGLYVEGSVICRLLMGTIGLERVRSNRVLAIVSNHNEQFARAAINSINAARATYGLRCAGVLELSFEMKMATEYSASGMACGHITGFDELCEILDERRGDYDAVAITSVIDMPFEYHTKYYEGGMVNPWGAVEAMLTHAVSSLYDVPSAHAPMFESKEVAELDLGVVDPRMAAEVVSVSFLQCVLKGLHRAPRIGCRPGDFSVNDVSCLVIPNGCIGLPTLAALEQGIPIIVVQENENLMKNDLCDLPWKKDQLWIVENYWEAAGVLDAMRVGFCPRSVRRPF